MITLLIDNKQVDLSQDVQIKLTYQSTDTSNPVAISNSFSKTVTLPGTPNNNQIFGNIYRLDTVTNDSAEYRSGYYFDPHKKVDFTLLNGSQIIEQGYIKMNAINNELDNISYEITLYGGLGDFFYNLQTNEDGTERKLSDLYFQWIPVLNNKVVEKYPSRYEENAISIINWGSNVIARSWTTITPEDKEGFTFITDDVTAIPTYNGCYDDFQSDTMIFDCVGGVWGSETTEGWQQYPDFMEGVFSKLFPTKNGNFTMVQDKVNPLHKFGVAKTYRDMEPFEAGCLRAQYLNPGIKLSKLMRAISNPENNGGYNVKWSDTITSNPYWQYSWIVLPKISMDEQLQGADNSTGKLSSMSIEFTNPDISGLKKPRLVMPLEVIYTCEAANFGVKYNFVEQSLSKPAVNVYDEPMPSNPVNRREYLIYRGSVTIIDLAISLKNGGFSHYIVGISNTGGKQFGDGEAYNLNNDVDCQQTVFNYWKQINYGSRIPNTKFDEFYDTNVSAVIVENDFKISWPTNINQKASYRVDGNPLNIEFDLPENVDDILTIYYSYSQINLIGEGTYIPEERHIYYKVSCVQAASSYNEDILYSSNNLIYNYKYADVPIFTRNNSVQFAEVDGHPIYIRESDQEYLDITFNLNKRQLFAETESPFKYLTDFTKLMNFKYNYDHLTKTVEIMPSFEYYQFDDVQREGIDFIIDRSKVKINPILSEEKYLKFELEKPETYPIKLWKKLNGEDYDCILKDTGYSFNNNVKNIFDGNIYKTIISYLHKSPFFGYINKWEEEGQRLDFINSVKPNIGKIPTLQWTLFNGENTNEQTIQTDTELDDAEDTYPMKLVAFNEKNEYEDISNSFVFLNGFVNNSYVINDFTFNYYWPKVLLTDKFAQMNDIAGGECYLWSFDCGQELSYPDVQTYIAGRYSAFAPVMPWFSRWKGFHYSGGQWYKSGYIFSWDISENKWQIENEWNKDMKFCTRWTKYFEFAIDKDRDPQIVEQQLDEVNFKTLKILNFAWQSETNDKYDYSNKEVTLSVKFLKRPKDALRKLYIFDNQQWTLTKISDYDAVENDFCSATFLKVNDVENYKKDWMKI